MNSAYLAACVAGAIVLAVQAIQQFRESGKSIVFKRFTVLRTVQINSISTFGERARGAAFYVAIYLLIYLTLLTSEQALQIIIRLSGDHAGPTGASFLSDNSLIVNGLDLGKPFYIATLIMVTMASGLLAPLERIICSIAHRAANIPNGLYRIIQYIDRFFEPDKDGSNPKKLSDKKSDLLSRFEEIFPPSTPEDDWMSGFNMKDLKFYLRQIDSLYSGVIGTGRFQYFSTETTDAMSEIHNELTNAHGKLSKELSAMTEKDAEIQNKFYEDAVNLCDNMKAIFAVQFIRNGRSLTLPTLHPKDSVDKLYIDLNRHLCDNEEAKTDALLGAALISIMGSFILTVAMYWTFVEIFLDLEEMNISKADAFREILKQASNVPVMASAMCFVSGYLTILIRDIRREQGKWESWKLQSPPVSRLLVAVLLPSFMGMICASFVLLMYNVTMGIVRTSDQFHDFFTDNLRYLLFFFPFSACVSVGVLFATDQHENLVPRKTVLLMLIAFIPASLWALACVLVAVPNFTTAQSGWNWSMWYLRETLSILIPITFFLIFYAILLEIWEKNRVLPTSNQRNTK